MGQVCPLCGIDDYLESGRLPGGETLYICRSERKHPDEPYSWTYDDAGKARGYPQEGLAAELNLFEDMSKCFHDGDGWLEYGIVEDRFKALGPDKFEIIRGIYGHTILDGHRKYSMSTYIARHVFSKLESLGEVPRDRSELQRLIQRDGPVPYLAVRAAQLRACRRGR